MAGCFDINGSPQRDAQTYKITAKSAGFSDVPNTAFFCINRLNFYELPIGLLENKGAPMINFQTIFFATGLSLAGSIVVAQQSAATLSGSETATSSELAVGRTPPQTAVPSMTTESFGDWVVRCAAVTSEGGDASAPIAGRICEMTQEHSDRASGMRVLAIGIGAIDGGAGLTLVAPFGLKLAEGLLLENGPGYRKQFEFETCLPAGCVVRSELSATEIDDLTSQQTLSVTMISTDGSALGVALSTDGMRDSWERLQH